MPILATPLDVAATDPLTSHRHRPVREESFPTHPGSDYEVREAAYLRSLLADPLGELARTATDAIARAIAEEALAGGREASDPFVEHARLEAALERIAATTRDDAARAIAEDAVSLYRGR
jgi:hypothetical protein